MNDDSYWSSDYYRNRKYYENTYSRDSPYEKYLQNRQKIGIAIFGLDNSGISTVPPSCPDHPHIPLQQRKSDGKIFCRECGFIEEPRPKPKPTKPSSSTSQQQIKVKQKPTAQSKSSFITQLPDRRNKRPGGRLGAPDETSELSNDEYDWIRSMWGGNITDSTES